jgi:hypothetical protein
MLIDNSAASTFKECPWKYYEAYIRKSELIPKGDSYGPLDFGTRMHELLEEHYKGENKYNAHENDVLEMEAQLMIEAYKARYPEEEWLELVDVEKSFQVQLPHYCFYCFSNDFVDVGEADEAGRCNNCKQIFEKRYHIYTGKIDIVFRGHDGRLYIMDHKTEKRGAKSNLPQKWAEKDQASLYLWAAEKIYGEKPNNFIVNVLTRQSDKGMVGPSFPERQKLERSEANVEHAVRDIVYWAEQIERCISVFKDSPWPANRENCYGWGPCEYSLLHGYGEDTELIREHKFQTKKEYIFLEGVPILQ